MYKYLYNIRIYVYIHTVQNFKYKCQKLIVNKKYQEISL